MFNPYFRTSDAKSEKINKSSHGLGLNISKRIALQLGGDLTVSSEVGKGTIFQLSLNCEKSLVVVSFCFLK